LKTATLETEICGQRLSIARAAAEKLVRDPRVREQAMKALLQVAVTGESRKQFHRFGRRAPERSNPLFQVSREPDLDRGPSDLENVDEGSGRKRLIHCGISLPQRERKTNDDAGVQTGNETL
jgi:hypothetical protein